MHFPVYNKSGDIVTSSVTTLDVHDISRICCTYAVDAFYVVTPLKTQQDLVQRMMDHWLSGYGAEYNPTRKAALLHTRVVNILDEVIQEVFEKDGKKPLVVIPDAKSFPKSQTYSQIKKEISKDHPILIVFGTGWGLERGLVERADYVLAPIEGLNGYNHLPVRAAVAIILDRLFSTDSSLGH